MKLRRAPFAILATAVVIVFFAETVIRWRGILDFPLYDADNRIGYIPKPNQAGSFMNSNRWAFNELSMGTDRRFVPSDANDVLLVGDSIVLGGNQYDQPDKLGPVLESISGAVVWPISAGSWALQNEVQYMSDHPDVISSIDKIILVLNSGDFDKPSSWASELTHPRDMPLLATWYLFLRQIVRPSREVKPEMLVMPVDPFDALRSFVAQTDKPLDIWLYPNKEEARDHSLWVKHMQRAQRQLEEISSARVRIFDGSAKFGLTDVDYKDVIHPTPEANKKLAAAIAVEL